jgi:hypothetical protein
VQVKEDVLVGLADEEEVEELTVVGDDLTEGLGGVGEGEIEVTAGGEICGKDGDRVRAMHEG